MKIIYMGTPDFAVPTLEKIAKTHEVVAVYTQPDKPKNRGQKLVMSPVKEKALSLMLPVFQPASFKEEGVIDTFLSHKADVAVVAAYGQILPEAVLKGVPFGCINVHASLLPKYRGAAPIQQAILDGEKETGVTIQQMAKKLDTGDILLQKTVMIEEQETAETLHDKLAAISGPMVLSVLSDMEKGRLNPVPQDESKASYVGKIDKSMGIIRWEDSAYVIERQMRGLFPYPGAASFLSGKRIKLVVAKVVEGNGQPGEVIAVDKQSFTVACGTGALLILSLIPEGKKQMTTAEFLRGRAVNVGDRLGETS